LRVVLDTNILLAAFASRGLCEALFSACLQSHTILLSEHILTELHRHLVGKVRMSARQAREIEDFLRAHAELIVPAPMPRDSCRDADDLPILGTAIAAAADALVTGDKDLLTLRRINQIPILAPREFYELFK
jgi:uncharacterized protein